MTVTAAGEHTHLPLDEPAIECLGVEKAFGPTRALVDASLTVRRGEIHAILGENGSGKSTLVKILSGIQTADAGTVQSTPRAVSTSPAHHSVATVFQEVLIVPERSILDNVWLGTDGLFRARVDARTKRHIAGELLQRLCNRPILLDAPIGSLPLSDQQACCIARALVREPDVLILDEATSALDLETRDRFFELLRELRADGLGTIFISHRMDEILGLADRTTVMRAGLTVATLENKDATAPELVALMTERAATAESTVRAVGARDGDVVLRARTLQLAPHADPIDLEVRRGEIVGIAGLEGHGQEALLLSLWGEGDHPGAVERARPDGTAVTLRSAAHAARNKVAYVPRDRRRASIFASLSIAENFAVTTLAADARFGFTSTRARRARVDAYRSKLAIKLGRPEDPITTLSGGNQQKVIVARWLATDPDVLLLNDPTRGIDLGAKRDIYLLLDELTAAGAAVVMLSSELEEHLTVMDRVIVMREQSVFTTLDRDQLNRQALVSAFFGLREEDPR